jgi:hypothetical protein
MVELGLHELTMKTKLEPPPEFASQDVMTTQEPLLELPPEPPPPDQPQQQPKPPEPFLRRG